jgi:hypothetical protein
MAGGGPQKRGPLDFFCYAEGSCLACGAFCGAMAPAECSGAHRPGQLPPAKRQRGEPDHRQLMPGCLCQRGSVSDAANNEGRLSPPSLSSTPHAFEFGRYEPEVGAQEPAASASGASVQLRAGAAHGSYWAARLEGHLACSAVPQHFQSVMPVTNQAGCRRGGCGPSTHQRLAMLLAALQPSAQEVPGGPPRSCSAEQLLPAAVRLHPTCSTFLQACTQHLRFQASTLDLALWNWSRLEPQLSSSVPAIRNAYASVLLWTCAKLEEQRTGLPGVYACTGGGGAAHFAGRGAVPSRG